MKINTRFLQYSLIFLFSIFSFEIQAQTKENYQELIDLFHDWRAFENPPIRAGAPDYTASTFATRYKELKKYQQRLADIDHGAWNLEQKADWYILLAELNGFDFNHRVLKPWLLQINLDGKK